MQLNVIVDSVEIFIGHDSHNEWLYVDWKGEHTQESSRAAGQLMLDSLRAWPCHKILNDNSSITRTSVQLIQWGVWLLDAMRAAGLQYIAWVLPHSLLARQAVETVLYAIETPRVGTFDDVASACVWLQQQPIISGK
jgi:hypothetical protein